MLKRSAGRDVFHIRHITQCINPTSKSSPYTKWFEYSMLAILKMVYLLSLYRKTFNFKKIVFCGQ